MADLWRGAHLMGGALTRMLGLGSASVSTLAGSLVYRTTNQAVSANTDVQWQSEVYDTANYFTVGTSAVNFAIPATGLYRFQVNGSISNASSIDATKTYKNGSGVVGLHSAGFPATTNLQWGNGASAVLSLSAADAVKVQGAFNTSTYGYSNDSRLTWHSVEPLSAATRYALVYPSASASITTGAYRTVAYNTEIADTDSIHDTVTNNSRLTVPSGFSARARLSWGIVTSNVNNSVIGNCAKNGTTSFAGAPSKSLSGSGNKIFTAMGPPINVSAADYFEHQILCDVNFSLLNDPYTWFCLESVPATNVACIAKKTSNQTITTSYADVTFDTDEYDDASIHDTSSNTERFVVPAGKTRARFHFAAQPSAAGGTISATGKKNNASITGGTPSAAVAGAYGWIGFSSPWLSVTPGDYFSVEVKVTSGTVTVGAGTWAALECE